MHEGTLAASRQGLICGYFALALAELKDRQLPAAWRNKLPPVPNPTESMLGHNLSSKAEVDAVVEQEERAGAVIVKAANNRFWGGHAGYFQDTNQHPWGIAWNPQWVVPE